MNNEFRGVPFETLKEMTVGEVKALTEELKCQ